MYTRTYYPNEREISLPKNYDGTTFSEERSEVTEEAVEASAGGEVLKSSILKRLPLGGILSSFSFLGDGEFKLGSEEIIIIAIALFLFFTKEADKECGIMLLLLLLIK